MSLRTVLATMAFMTSPYLFGIERVTIYGDDSYPPYSFIDKTGEFKGIYVDFIRQLSARMPGYQIELKPIPWKRGLNMLQKGEAFALFPPYQLKSREYIKYYSLPLHKESVVIVCNRKVINHPMEIFPDDFSNVTIGVNRGYLLSTALQSAIAAKKINIEEASGTETNLMKLAAERIDCYANDKLSIYHTLKKLKENNPNKPLKNLILTETVELSAENAYIAFSSINTPTYSSNFIESLNTAITQLSQSGAMNKIIHAYSQ